ncbi:hypothetical protein BD410DRAFT_153144 [Rickenella mellea]|uniref:N-acetyltransferase domain-containing protein n=1 Tax=Rickenella mellea TaxID=50990 RepID=A0A4Y7Q967_9AGAM|nr:hypothetical protein BD410DRAFT_153144 [Rickenella mellea]
MVRHFNLELGIFWDDPTTPEGQAPERNYVYLLRSTISDDLLKEASSLYSNHFGFWISEDIGRGTWRLSSRVKLSARRLREGYLFNDDCFISHVCDPASGKLIGYAFGTTAPDPTSPLNSGKKIMWIVVHKDFRSDRIATHLIAAATEKFPTLSILGIVSPHPWAIRAVMRVAGVDIRNIDLDFIAQHGSACLRAVGVPYVNDTMFFGSVFGKPDLDPSPMRQTSCR